MACWQGSQSDTPKYLLKQNMSYAVKLQRGDSRYFLTVSIAAACGTRQPEGAQITEIINVK